MKTCFECGGKYIEKEYNLTLSDGDQVIYVVESGVTAGKCNKCGELLFPYITLQKMESYEKLENLKKKVKRELKRLERLNKPE